MPFIDTKGLFGPVGKSYSDSRYNNQNDYDTWTDDKVISVNNGINLATGKPWTRADQGFGSYTDRADANGRAEAARQAAEDDDGFGGLLGALALGAGMYFGLPALFGEAAAGGITAAEAAAGMGGIDAAGWGGLIEGAGGLDLLGAAGGVGATGGNTMFGFDDLLSQWTDVPVDATQFADQSIVDLFNNAGMEGFNNYGVSYEDLAAELFNNAGMPGFDQYGNAASGVSIPDWLKNAPDTIKKAFGLTGGSGTGSGGGSLLGAGLGGLAGLLGGSKQAGTIDQTQTPWGPQQPYLIDAFNMAKQAANANNPLQAQANANFQSVLQGPTKNPMLGLDNPYLTKAINDANNDVTRAMMPAMNQANVASGSFGNSGVADVFSKNMLDAYSKNANDMRYKDYYAQQQLQQDAVGNTLGFTTGTSAFNTAPSQNYAKTVQGNYGGTTSSPYFTNNLNSILGGTTLGYNLFGGK